MTLRKHHKKYLILLLSACLSFFSFMVSAGAKELPKNVQPKLHRAVIQGDIDEVKRLIKSGHNVNEIYEGNSPFTLTFYSIKNNLLIAQSLINSGANLEKNGIPVFSKLEEIYEKK